MSDREGKWTKLTKRQLAVLAKYADTVDGQRYLQGFPGSSDLYSKGLLKWHGDQYGTHFYSITDTGRAALTRALGQ